jgi:DNA-directed RNA polymerase I subunit RPA2
MKESYIENLRKLFRPHLESFNYFLNEGLKKSIESIPKRFIEAPEHRLYFWWENPSILYPNRNAGGKIPQVYPKECREAKETYTGELICDFCYKHNDKPVKRIQRKLGDIPIMVMSDRCVLSKLSREELIKHGEEEFECGGYFSINGLEKLIRLLVVPRKNYPLALLRSAYKNRGPLYTLYGVQMRCGRQDQTTQTVVMHFLKDGSVIFRFTITHQVC